MKLIAEIDLKDVVNMPKLEDTDAFILVESQGKLKIYKEVA